AHLGDFAAVEHDAADQLHVEVAHAEHPLRGLAHGGESFGQDLVKRFPLGELFAELVRLGCQLGVREGLELGFQRVDLGDDLVERANVTVVGGAEYGLGERTEHAAVSCLGLEMQGRPRVRGRKITRKLWLARAYSRARSACSITVGTTSTMRGGFGHGLGCTSSRSRRIDEGLLRWAGC